PLELPLDRARPPAPTGAGDTVGIELPADLVGGLRELSQQRGSTLFMTMLTAFAILLHRYGGQPDLIIGTPALNRRRRELNRLIGFFVNTLALRIDLSDDPTFPQLQDRVRAVAIGAYAHQEVPFERVVEEVQPDRSTPQPLFQAMLAFQQEPAGPALPGLTFTPLELDTGTARFDLSLIVTERASTM